MKRRPILMELRARIPPDDLFSLRAKAAKSGMSVPQYLSMLAKDEEHKEKRRDHDFKLF